MRDLILVLTNSGDRSVSPVLDHLSNAGECFFRFDTEKFPSDHEVTLALAGNEVMGKICSIDLDRIKSVWWRRPVASIPRSDQPSGHAEFIREESGAALWSLYTTLTHAFWMNHPLIAVKLLEHNKLYQLMAASRLGLAVPRTIITNRPEEVLSFAKEQGGTVAVKLIKGNTFTKEGSKQASNVPLFAFTQQISERIIQEHLDDFCLSPVMVQEYIQKEIELRVTVVGQKVFACAIHSQDSEETKHDWRRYDFANVKHEPYELPVELESKLLSLVKMCGLGFGAIDLIRTPDGQYVFLEINSNGQWGWIEDLTGMPISKTIAETLAAPPSDRHTTPWYTDASN